ncbi:MAG: FAD-dependent oxidoreductase [Pseudomonadota bacterium]
MKQTTRVCIIGGGMMGAGLAYHLAHEGWRDIMLVEKGELTSGSTWHAAGQCPSFTGSYNLAKIHHYSNLLYPKLEAETGQYVSWHGCGGLRFAMNQTEIDWFHYVQGFAANVGFEMEIITPQEAEAYNPYVKTDGVLAVARTTMDGHVDPAGLCQALAAGARALGAEIVRNTLVRRIHRRPGGEWEVETSNGSIICEHVVNAAGCYARMVANMVGADAPITNIQHQYVVTEPLAPFCEEGHREIPVMRDPWCTSYYRQEQKAGLIGIYEIEGLVEAWPDGVPWEADHELFEADLERIFPWLERVMERMPIMANAGIKRVVNGAIPHTPDGSPLLGQAAGLPGFWMACGSSIGIAQGGGCGKYLAQMMVHGQAEINMLEFDPRRFGSYADPDYVRARSFEDYAHMYQPHFPGEERPAGRNARQSSLHDRLVARSAQQTVIFGWERPKYFGAAETPGFRHNETHEIVAREVRGVRGQVGVLDLSSFAKFWVRGADSSAFLNHCFANRIGRRDGSIALAHLLGDGGFIEGEMTVTRLQSDAYYLASGAIHQLRDLDRLNLHASGFDVEIEDVTDKMGVLVVAGPHARNLLQPLTDDDLSAGGFKWLTGRQIRLAGCDILALRVNYAGELGWELHIAMEDMPKVYDALHQDGASHGLIDFGVYALDSLRLEKAYRGFGSELTHEITPVEADLERFVDFTKDFVGKQGVLQRKQDGGAIRLVYLEVEAADHDIRGGEAVFAGGKLIGVTTSGGYGHFVEKSLGFAYIDAGWHLGHGSLEVQLLGSMRKATILEQPAYDPENLRQFQLV